MNGCLLGQPPATTAAPISQVQNNDDAESERRNKQRNDQLNALRGMAQEQINSIRGTSPTEMLAKQGWATLITNTPAQLPTQLNLTNTMLRKDIDTHVICDAASKLTPVALQCVANNHPAPMIVATMKLDLGATAHGVRGITEIRTLADGSAPRPNPAFADATSHESAVRTRLERLIKAHSKWNTQCENAKRNAENTTNCPYCNADYLGRTACETTRDLQGMIEETQKEIERAAAVSAFTEPTLSQPQTREILVPAYLNTWVRPVKASLELKMLGITSRFTHSINVHVELKSGSILPPNHGEVPPALNTALLKRLAEAIAHDITEIGNQRAAILDLQCTDEPSARSPAWVACRVERLLLRGTPLDASAVFGF